MATVLALPRTLSAIVCDLATTRERHAALDATTFGIGLTEDQDREWSDLDDRIDALDAEARAVVYDLTGVSFDMLERALS